MKNSIAYTMIAVGLALIAAYFVFDTDKPAENYDSFALCLKNKGAVMYGAYWCPHCQNEKKAFGDSFRHIDYVECTEQIQKCNEDKITGYPTWTFSDGRRLEGEQGLKKLAGETGCALPEGL